MNVHYDETVIDKAVAGAVAEGFVEKAGNLREGARDTDAFDDLVRDVLEAHKVAYEGLASVDSLLSTAREQETHRTDGYGMRIYDGFMKDVRRIAKDLSIGCNADTVLGAYAKRFGPKW